MTEAQTWKLLEERVRTQCQALDRHISRCLELGRSSVHELPELEKPQVLP